MPSESERYPSRHSNSDYLTDGDVRKIEESSSAIQRAFRYPDNNCNYLSFMIDNPLESENLPEDEVERIRQASRVIGRTFKYPQKNNG